MTTTEKNSPMSEPTLKTYPELARLLADPPKWAPKA